MSLSVDHQSSFADPTLLSLRSLDTIATDTALIVAPHPDDETLGCGGAIALLQTLGCTIKVLVISDGTLSHPRSVKYPAPRLRALRAAETLEALSILGVKETAATFLQLPDGAIPTVTSPRFEEAVSRCQAILKAFMPATLFLPWRFDPHPDHQATWQLIHTALHNLHQVNLSVADSITDFNYSPRLIEYPIWDWDPEQRGQGSFDIQIGSWRLDIQQVLATKLRAIAAYRSQTTNLIDDDPEGFQLTPEMLKNFAQPWELYLEEIG